MVPEILLIGTGPPADGTAGDVDSGGLFTKRHGGGGERAAGGPVTPDKAYLVNERGTEPFTGARGTLSVAPGVAVKVNPAGGPNGSNIIPLNKT
jgi:hypothetical protein